MRAIQGSVHAQGNERPVSVKQLADEAGVSGQLVYNEIPESVLARIHDEWHHPGVAQAVPLCFAHTDFDREMEDRRNFIIPKMKCPVHLIQAELDPGQNPVDYEGLEALGTNFSIEWIEGAGHFSHLEKPAEVTAALRRFLIEEAP